MNPLAYFYSKYRNFLYTIQVNKNLNHEEAIKQIKLNFTFLFIGPMILLSGIIAELAKKYIGFDFYHANILIKYLLAFICLGSVYPLSTWVFKKLDSSYPYVVVSPKNMKHWNLFSICYVLLSTFGGLGCIALVHYLVNFLP